ncbi:MAG: methionine--tRNA ligase, partial [Nitrosopumilus sp.]|nr:methionine--tRNA ligase [Nitrosopumilus sp.]
NAARSMAIALFPFLPESSQKIWAQLGLSENVQNSSWASLSELNVLSGHILGASSPLFTKVETSDIEKYKKKSGTL